ncbi:MAG TPA: hypothetical protein DCM45_02995, partial [Clostridiales bacterium]|nr:hypothetical protein [Clostridiales bacterium]
MKRRQPAGRPSNHTKPAQQQTKNQASRMKRRAPARKRDARRTRLIIAIAILGVLILIAGGILIYIYDLLGNINTVPSGQQTIPSEFDQPTESLVNPLPEKKGIYNILLLGVDSRDQERIDERSDSMMILTIDQVHGKIKLTSLQRDMLVFIPGVKEPKKLNSANSLGGPLLVMRTVNEALRLNINKYMLVNMFGMEQIIDIAGGVWLDIENQQIEYINQTIHDANINYPDTAPSPLLTQAGRQLLNGRQAVGYARIRKLDSDYKRMERQRAVIQALLDTFLAADLGTKNKMMAAGLGLITTNMSSDEILKIGINMVPALSGEINQLQIPIEGYFKEYSGSEWVNLCDFNGMIPLLQEFIYGEVYPFDKVKV